MNDPKSTSFRISNIFCTRIDFPFSPFRSLSSSRDIQNNTDEIKVKVDLTKVSGLTVLALLLASYAITLFNLIKWMMLPINSKLESFSRLYHGVILYIVSFRMAWHGFFTALLLLMCIHLFFGYIATYFLQTIRKDDGGFNLTVSWVSFRLGLNHNEVIIKGLIFHNPPNFTQTPCFLSVDEARLVVDFLSVIDVFVFGSSRTIVVPSVEVSGVQVYIEKGEKKYYGTNIWAALGAQNVDDERSVRAYVFRELSTKADGNIAWLTRLFGASNGKEEEAISLAFSPEHNKNDSSPNDPDDVTDDNDETEGPWTQVSSAEVSDDECSLKEAPLSSKSSTCASSVYAPPRTNQPNPIRVTKPLKYMVIRLTLLDFKLHAQDLLNAQHTDVNSASYIHIPILHFTSKQLSKTVRRRGAPLGDSCYAERNGLDLNELLWRLVYGAVAELFTTNQIAMLRIVASATVNQTTNAVLDVAKLTTQSISNAVFNYNPVVMFNATKRSLEKVVATEKVDPIPRSLSVRHLKVTALTMHLIKLREVRFSDGRAPSTMKVMARLKYRNVKGTFIPSNTTDGLDHNTELMKSSALSKDRYDEVTFDTVWTLQPLFSLDAVLHVRVYEAGLLTSNTFIAEMLLPIRENTESSSPNAVKMVGVYSEVVAWHSLKGQGEYSGKVLGKMRLGLALVR